MGASRSIVLGAASASRPPWYVPAASAVSLGDSYAVRQVGPLEAQLGIPVLQHAIGGSFALHWVNTWLEWSPSVAALDGPVFVLLNAGANDERATPPFGSTPEITADRVNQLVAGLTALRFDLQVVVAGYNGGAAAVTFQDHLDPDAGRHRYLETVQLDSVLGFADAAHPDVSGFYTRIRHILHTIGRNS